MHLPRFCLILLAGLLAACAARVRGPRGDYVDFIRADQVPPQVGSRSNADSLWGRVAESATGDGVGETRRADLDALVTRFAPTLILPRGDFAEVAGRKYRLFPTDVVLFLDTLRVDRVRAAPYGLHDSQDFPFAELDPAVLIALADSAQFNESDPDLLEIWYFDFPGTDPQSWWDAYGRFRTGADSARWAQPTVYAHPFVDGDGRLVIQYWFFWPINDFIGNHEGDTEHINVVVNDSRDAVVEVQYFFHARSIRLPQGEYRPEIVDSTHPVVHAGGRAYNVLDYPVRLLSNERNEGSHGSYPYAGEWEAAAGLGMPESVVDWNGDSSRVIPWHEFRVVLTPEPARIDYRRHPQVLKDWAWLAWPIRMGYPAAPSLGGEIKFADVGNRSPYGFAFNAGWNRTSPGLTYPAYPVHHVGWLRSGVEDVLQPWYWLYVFRTPRYIPDWRGTGVSRERLEALGLAPRSGWGERGLGSTLLGVSITSMRGDLADTFGSSVGISLWRNFWLKARYGWLEFIGGYQKLARDTGPSGSLFVYPFTANVVVAFPEARFRPYLGFGGGAYGWESQIRAGGDTQIETPGWSPGWNVGVGLEYYLRPRVAFDIGVRYHQARGPEAVSKLGPDGLRFTTIWFGHYVRF